MYIIFCISVDVHSNLKVYGLAAKIETIDRKTASGAPPFLSARHNLVCSIDPKPAVGKKTGNLSSSRFVGTAS